MPRNGTPNGETDCPIATSNPSDRLPAVTRRSHPLRPTGGGGWLLVLVSAVTSLTAAGRLPGRMRIRWGVGTSHGPEFAPSWVVLVPLPVALVVLVLGARLLVNALQRREQVERARPVCEACTLVGMLAVVGTQVGLVPENLVWASQPDSDRGPAPSALISRAGTTDSAGDWPGSRAEDNGNLC
jgi:hypothetical protein